MTSIPPRLAASPLRLAVLAALAGHAVADEPGLQLSPVTVTGSRVEARSFELPYSVDVVDSRRIGEGQLKVNASEALAGVPGIVALNRQNYAQDLQISSRGYGARAGFGVRGVKLIADGIPASIPDGQGQAATFNLDVAERIEVLRGPFSSIYGNHAGGVIQLFSRDGSGAPRVSASAGGGSWGTSKVGLGAEGSSGGIGYVLDSSRFETDGYREHSAANRDQSFAKLSWTPDADSRLQVVANALRQDNVQDPLGLTWSTYSQRGPRAVESGALTGNTRKTVDHLQGGATYSRRFGDQQVEVRAYSGSRRNTQYQTTALGVVEFDRQFQGAGARWSLNRPAGSGEITLIAGLDYDYSKDDRQGYTNVSGNKGSLTRNEFDTVRSTSEYLQAMWKSGGWLFSAGAAHTAVKFKLDDRFTGDGDGSARLDFSGTTASLGASYQLTPATNAYVGAATGFETPTFNEMFYSGSTSPVLNLNRSLKPAHSRQVEAGIKTLLGETARANIAVFQIRTTDELVVDTSFGGGKASYLNAGSTLRRGIEIGLDAEIARNWRTRLAFTQLHAVYDEDFLSKGVLVTAGKRIPGIPASTLYGELAWQPLPGVTAAAEAIYRSHIHVEDTNSERAAPAYAIANLRLTAEQVSGSWRISEMLRFDNVFDRRYIGSVQVSQNVKQYYEPGAGFGWFAGIRAQYLF